MSDFFKNDYGMKIRTIITSGDVALNISTASLYCYIIKQDLTKVTIVGSMTTPSSTSIADFIIPTTLFNQGGNKWRAVVEIVLNSIQSHGDFDFTVEDW